MEQRENTRIFTRKRAANKNRETMVKYHGVLKQVNHVIPYIYHAQYMKEDGVPQLTMVYHVIPWYTM